MNSFTGLRERCLLYLKDKSVHTIIIAFTIGVALFELGAIILINRFNKNESKAYALCEKNFNNQQYAKAVQYLKGFVKKFPESEKIVDAMYALAISHQNQRDFVAESKVWQQIIKYSNPIDPERVQEAYYNLGICQEKLGNINFALKSYEAASKEGPNTSIMSRALFSAGRLYEQQKLDSKAALVYRLVMQKFPDEDSAQKAANQLSDLNLKHLLSEYQTTYRVKKGDNLTSIAKRFDTTIAVIMKANGLSDTSIKIGMKLKVPKVRFSMDVGIEDKLAYLICDGYIVKQYHIATDAAETPTPTGDFSIGQVLSDGSIRLNKDDVEELVALMSNRDTVHITAHLELRPWYSWVNEINNEDNSITNKDRRTLISQKD
ncbi:MAG: LysM peptidoglycan-binding domain-containing protein [Candidatus Poribacteria bacterium]